MRLNFAPNLPQVVYLAPEAFRRQHGADVLPTPAAFTADKLGISGTTRVIVQAK